MKNKKRLFPIAGLCVLSCGALVSTMIGLNLFKPASGVNDDYEYVHYSINLPDNSKPGCKEYWLKVGRQGGQCVHQLYRPDCDPAKIKEGGQGSIEGLSTTDDRYLAPYTGACPYYVYISSPGDYTADTFINANTGAAPGNQVHYTTYGYETNHHAFLDSSYVTSDVPNDGGYITSGNLHCLDLGTPNISNFTVNEYIYNPTAENSNVFVGLCSTLSYYDNQAKPVYLDEVFECKFNELEASECKLPHVELKNYGETIFLNYKIFDNLAFPQSAMPLYSHLTLKRKMNTNLRGTIRMGWITADAWPTGGGSGTSDRTTSAICKIANNRIDDPSALNGKNPGRTSFNKGYANIPIDTDHIKIASGGNATIKDGKLTKVQTQNQDISFTVNVSDDCTQSDGIALCALEFDVTAMNISDASYNVKEFFHFRDVTGQIEQFTLKNTAKTPKTDITEPFGLLAKATDYHFRRSDEVDQGRICTITVFMPLSVGDNTISFSHRRGSWGTSYHEFSGIRVYSNCATLTAK